MQRPTPLIPRFFRLHQVARGGLRRRSYATPTAAADQAPALYCADLVKRLDPDAWLCSRFWPADVREMWLGWRAFNLELHLITTTITQPAIAQMRYQFWRDTLKQIWADNPPKHPVAIQLAKMKSARPVQRYYLKQLIDHRANHPTPASSPTLQSHIELHSPLSSSLLLGPLPLLLPPTHPAQSTISHSLSHLSSLLTCVTLLRSLPFAIQKRSLPLPRDLCVKYGVVDEEVFRKGVEAGGGNGGLRDVCFEIGTRGMDEIITARSHLTESGGKIVPASVVPLFLSSVPAERYLKRLEAVDFDVFHPDLQKADWKLAPSIMYSAWSGKL